VAEKNKALNPEQIYTKHEFTQDNETIYKHILVQRVLLLWLI